MGRWAQGAARAPGGAAGSASQPPGPEIFPDSRFQGSIPQGATMARVNKMSVLKRQRERKKAEKAAIKREARARRAEDEPAPEVASRDDLAGYGLLPEEEEEAGEEPGG